MGKRRLILAIAGFAVLVLAVPGCNNGSGTVTGPATGTAGANITGSWSGAFQSDDQANCGNSGASATFQQMGSEVTGNLQTSDCGVRGYFKATISGSNVSDPWRWKAASAEALRHDKRQHAVAPDRGPDQPLVTDDRTIMSGGVVTLNH
jgi:hypothetical protein